MRWGGGGGRLNQWRNREKAKGRTRQRDTEKVDLVAFGKQSGEGMEAGKLEDNSRVYFLCDWGGV